MPFGDARPCFTKASIKIPPILPAPMMASRLRADDLFAMIATPFRPFRKQSQKGTFRPLPGNECTRKRRIYVSYRTVDRGKTVRNRIEKSSGWILAGILTFAAAAQARQQQAAPSPPPPAAQADAAPQISVVANTTGSVRTADGTPVPGATVRLVSLDTNKSWVSWTDAAGNFAFPNLPKGRYHVETSQIGFQASSIDVLLPILPKGPIPVVLRVATMAELNAAISASAAAAPEHAPGPANTSASNPGRSGMAGRGAAGGGFP